MARAQHSWLPLEAASRSVARQATQASLAAGCVVAGRVAHLMESIPAMARVLVSGLINVETTVAVEGFPVAYAPVRYPFFGVRSTVSGVGLNVAKSLATLGDEVELLSIVGADAASSIVRGELGAIGLGDAGVLPLAKETAQSAILYDPEGRRAINVDLKDIQETAYPADRAAAALARCEAAVLCNINFSRAMLPAAKAAGRLVACDVHAISSMEDAYNRDFMAAADILFQSDASLPVPAEEWLRRVVATFGTRIAVVGLGEKGALMLEREGMRLTHLPAVATRPVVNTIGAGDALFSSFLHFHLKEGDAREALALAQCFASWKIGVRGAAEGFCGEAEVRALRSGAR